MVIELTKVNFEKEILESGKPVLIDFWAEWCGPCRMMSPVVDEVAELRDDIKVGKVNVDNEQELAAAFGIESIPTLILIKDGKAVWKSEGYIEKSKLIELIEE